jgi:hypothetical protein
MLLPSVQRVLSYVISLPACALSTTRTHEGDFCVVATLTDPHDARKYCFQGVLEKVQLQLFPAFLLDLASKVCGYM